MKLTEVKPDYLKVILQGPPGRGKTIAGISFPKPMFVFDFEQRMLSAANYYRDRGMEKVLDGVEIESFTNWMHVQEKLEYWVAVGCPYKTVGFDSLTSMADVILGQLTVQKGSSGGGKKIGGFIQAPSIEDYGGESAALTTWILLVKRLKANVWMTAHVIQTETQDITSKQVRVDRTLLTAGKKIAAKMPAYFDEQINFNIIPSPIVGAAPQFMVFTRPNGTDYAKTAFQLPPSIDWTDKNFYEMVYAKYFG